MKAEITMSQLWWNPSVMEFFMRNQAQDTLEELINKYVDEDKECILDKIEDYAEASGYDLDDLEVMFYNDTVEEIIEELGLPTYEDE